MEETATKPVSFSVLPKANGQWQPCPDLMTAEEAVIYLRLDINGRKDPLKTLEYYRGRGLLKATQVGKYLRYRLEDLKEFLKVMSDRTNEKE